MSKFVEGHIKEHETALDRVIHLINSKGETTPDVQQLIDHALDELPGWYEMRDMFG